MFFDFLDYVFNPWPEVKKFEQSKTCKECGRIYSDPDSAALCGDWDKILGISRHDLRK